MGKDFAEVDERLKPVIRENWGGRVLPFPILLDADGSIQQTFGVEHWPTTLLFDPDGKLIGEVSPDHLETRLNPVPLVVALPRQLDRNVGFYVSDGTFENAISYLKNATHREFEIEPAALRSLSQQERTKVPLKISGLISLRSALELLLDPFDLTYRVGEKGYVISQKPLAERAKPASLSAPQAQCVTRIEGKLKGAKCKYDFKNTPLTKVAEYFEAQSGENVVLDPRGRLEGKIEPETPVSGSGNDVAMGEALRKMIDPINLQVSVRDEVIVLEVKNEKHPH